ncbi:SMI1/KNR4 family protein [Tenacibaculum ovolyticum]|uniref:SMI1/KNR4 family protein n=1 Tax=Tenacibaculum ovolyticum TaxID=104270 RepID=UPI0007ECD2D1|nr:SMI1/KNR4 family protein [Tenacibaculum ovolyticum]
MFLNSAKSITKSDIKNIEKLIGLEFPLKFKEHYLMYNGGFPLNDCFLMVEDDTYLSINGFYPIKYHYNEIEDWTLEEIYFHLKTKQSLPENFIPFASDLGGNKICVNVKSEDIYIVYMDLGNPMEEEGAIRKIADSFQYFIDNLEEEEEEDV